MGAGFLIETQKLVDSIISIPPPKGVQHSMWERMGNENVWYKMFNFRKGTLVPVNHNVLYLEK